MTERDALTDWFHSLAENAADALLELASQENIDQLRLHVSRSTPHYPLPEALDPKQFAEAVFAFRENESSWNPARVKVVVASFMQPVAVYPQLAS
jgi:hypothetical protein